MLFKRGSTISAAEGGCQAEVGGSFFACSLPSAPLILHPQLRARWQVLALLPPWEVRPLFSLELQDLRRRAYRAR